MILTSSLGTFCGAKMQIIEVFIFHLGILSLPLLLDGHGIKDIHLTKFPLQAKYI